MHNIGLTGMTKFNKELIQDIVNTSGVVSWKFSKEYELFSFLNF